MKLQKREGIICDIIITSLVSLCFKVFRFQSPFWHTLKITFKLHPKTTIWAGKNIIVRIHIFTLDKIVGKNVVAILKQKIRNLGSNHEIFSFGQLLQVVFILVARIVIFGIYCGQNSFFFFIMIIFCMSRKCFYFDRWTA